VAIVLGADAIEQSDIAGAAAALSKVKARVIVCVDACGGPALACWFRRGFDNVVATRDLAARIASMAPEVARPPIEAHLWQPRATMAGTPARAAVDAVERLAHLGAQDWADALGWSRSYLLKTCRSAFDLAPKEMLLLFVLATFEELRIRDVTIQDCAVALGYCDGPTLCEAVLRARVVRERTARRMQNPNEQSSKSHFHASRHRLS
jgi:AraC-like DNA-binding protein